MASILSAAGQGLPVPTSEVGLDFSDFLLS